MIRKRIIKRRIKEIKKYYNFQEKAIYNDIPNTICLIAENKDITITFPYDRKNMDKIKRFNSIKALHRNSLIFAKKN